jgi:drug/metabolite transporter (DMT)-like permease
MTPATPPAAAGASVAGILFAIAATTAFSVNDVAIKWLSDDYPLHQITFIRSLVGILVTLAVFVPLEGPYARLVTRRPGFHLLRGLIVVTANMAFYAGLATLPLGEATAIYFVSPLFITALSVLLLGDSVGPRRWAAVAAGMIGVVIVIQPGSAAFQLAALLPLVGAFFYALLQITSRKIGVTESASTMAFYLNLVFIVFSGAVGLSVGDGRFAGGGDASIEFLLRAWVWPQPGDLLLLAFMGVIGSTGAYCVSQAYRIAQPGLIAPFEYVGMPLAIVWSIAIWGDWPDVVSWIGIALIAGAGIFVFWREARAGRQQRLRTPVARGR